MKSSPSIAVMLGGKASEDEGGEPGLAEAKASAKDAATAFASAVASKDADGIVRAFRSLSTLCGEVDSLEDSGESDESPESSGPASVPPPPAKDETADEE